MPLLVRGPGFGHGRADTRIAVNADFAPTFLELAGDGARARELDGRSLLAASRPRPILIEGEQLRYRGVRAGHYVYIEWASGDRELYDLSADPHQLESVAERRPGLAGRLAAKLERLADCEGSDCRHP